MRAKVAPGNVRGTLGVAALRHDGHDAARPGRDTTTMPIANLLRLALLITILAPVSARAAGGCEEVIFDCGRYPTQFAFKNLKQLRQERRSDAWIRKNCSPNMASPPGCDWRRSLAPALPTQTVVLTDARPTAPTPRDPGGRIGPTPAPTLQNPTQEAGLGDRTPYSAEVTTAAGRYQLPRALVRAVMQIESGGNPIALSNRGAIGLMQLMPDTAKAMGVQDPYDPAQNIAGGARFLRVLANRFNGDLVKVLSAYHAGSVRVQTRDATPFAATDDYVRKVLRAYYQLRDAESGTASAPAPVNRG
jgi:hypothetical protein